MMSASCWPSMRKRMAMRFALACRAALVSASCATRKQAVSVSMASRPGRAYAKKSVSHPVALRLRSSAHCSAAARPRASSAGGPQVERHGAHLLEGFAGDVHAFLGQRLVVAAAMQGHLQLDLDEGEGLADFVMQAARDVAPGNQHYQQTIRQAREPERQMRVEKSRSGLVV